MQFLFEQLVSPGDEFAGRMICGAQVCQDMMCTTGDCVSHIESLHLEASCKLTFIWFIQKYCCFLICIAFIIFIHEHPSEGSKMLARPPEFLKALARVLLVLTAVASDQTNEKHPNCLPRHKSSHQC